MSNKISRAEFIRTSLLGAAGLVAGSQIKLSATPDVKPGADVFHPKWKSVYKPDFQPRLSETTRELARRGLSGEWGKQGKADDWDFSECFEGNPGPQVQYGLAAISVAKNAPLRVLPEEWLTGAATLAISMSAQVPCLKTHSVTHTTFGFERAIHLGYSGLKREILERKERGGLDDEGLDVLDGMLLCIDAAGIWNQRHIDELQKMLSSATGEQAKNIRTRIALLKNVPENKPENFREAIQCLWSMWEFSRLMGDWSGIGRIDKMLGTYLQQDLEKGAISLDEAREYIAHFWIKGTGWITTLGKGTGDAQFYQNIILSGIDKDGNDVTNEVTYLVLDVVEELHISDFPIAVRVNSRTPDKLLRRIAEVQRHGGGIISLYNEEVVIKAMTEFGYPLEEAREFANDGCWETIIPGKTNFIYFPRDMVAVMQQTLQTGNDAEEVTDYGDFDTLYNAFLANLRTDVNQVHGWIDTTNKNPKQGCAIASLFVEGCVENARSYENHGPKYAVRGIHYGGIADVANSMLVLKKLVYEEQYLTLPEFVNILRKNWEGHEALRQLIRNRFEFFGNDNDEADAMTSRIFNDYASIVSEIKEREGVLRHGALSTFGREIDWKDRRAATPQGSRSGDILATNCSPTPGSDKKGPTSAINSYCKLDFTRMPNGGTLELKILPQSVEGENGINALMSLTKTFRKRGGFYMHVDVVDSSLLIDAQMHPEKYPNLPVRVAGWSARFNTLEKDWQDMIIQRTQQIV